ncbi:hypothetical protein [Polynucleobacter sinensis]|uniref:hypothetical protein n=1 Tax=Polynucleobacter sinensis TaxID=1743157 RepID=UPI000780BA0E|nr:hypothetical protein [Polynucleobacter sinensis]
MKNLTKLISVGVIALLVSIGGCGKSGDNTPGAANVQPPPPAIPAKVYRADNMILMFKNSSNPFEIREKVVGKKIETQMFVEKFIDEGTTAKMIDANTGFFCRMPGSEYGQHNKRGVIVVVGTFVQEAGNIGLDDCHFVSNDLDWKATDSYEELIK